MSETRFYPVVTNNTDGIEKLDGQIIFDIDNKSISIDIDNSRFAVQSVDSELSEISKNPVQNKVIAEKLFDLEEKVSKIEAPSAWLTGTSGSATLPRAGLYEVKVTKPFGEYNVDITAFVNFAKDGTKGAQSTAISYVNAGQFVTTFIVVDPTGVMTFIDPTTLVGDTSITISYRRISIA